LILRLKFVILLLLGIMPYQCKNNVVRIIKQNEMIQHSYTGQIANNIAVLIEEMKLQGITNEFAQIGMLSVIGKESGFIPQCEKSYSYTSNVRLRKLFGARLGQYSESELTALKSNDIEFFDAIYGRGAKFKWNTGNTEVGDGFKYRGRGFNQITFKSSYKAYGDTLGIDLVNNPDLLNTVEVASKLAVRFLLKSIKSMKINPNNFLTKESATYAFVKANAGTNKDMTKSDTFKKAKEIEKNLTII